MMTIAAPFTEFYSTPNQSPRLAGTPRLGAGHHHSAMTGYDTLRDMIQYGTKQVSAHEIVKNDRIGRMISDPNMRAWSFSSAYWDSALHTQETCNESVDGWTISDASHWSLAKLDAYFSLLEGWWPHRSGDDDFWTVLGHREIYTIHGASYATACPGGMNLNLIADRAQQLRVGATLMDYTNSAGTGFAQMLQRALRFDVRPNGFGADWKLGPTIWERLGQAVDALTGVNAKLDVIDKKIDAGMKVTVTLDSAQLQEMSATITEAVLKVQRPLSAEDIGAVATATNDDADERVRTRLGV